MQPKVIVIDTETTGLDRNLSHVIDVCIRDLSDTREVFYRRVKPPIPIPPDIAAIHGISDALVEGCPTFGSIADDLAEQIEWADVITGYNPDFDIDMLKSELERAGRSIKWPKVVVCAKRLWDKQDPRHLQNAYKTFVDPAGFEGAHGAVADVAATAAVIKGMIAKYGLQDVPWAELVPPKDGQYGNSHHVRWRDTNKDELVLNFGKHKDMSFHLIPGGYLRYMIDKDFPPHVKNLSQKLVFIRASAALTENDWKNALAEWAKENS